MVIQNINMKLQEIKLKIKGIISEEDNEDSFCKILEEFDDIIAEFLIK